MKTRREVWCPVRESNQAFSSQLTANDDVVASAKFQLESIGVRMKTAKPLVDIPR